MKHRSGGYPFERTIHLILLFSLASVLIASGEPKAASGWIRSSGFLVGGNVTVLFNGIAAIAVEIVDDGTIRAAVPALPPGSVTIAVTMIAGTATLAGDGNGPAIVSVPALTDGGFLLLAAALLTAGLFLLKR